MQRTLEGNQWSRLLELKVIRGLPRVIFRAFRPRSVPGRWREGLQSNRIEVGWHELARGVHHRCVICDVVAGAIEGETAVPEAVCLGAIGFKTSLLRKD